MNNNTIPEQRPDKNGKVVTRHVKPAGGAKASVPLPAPNVSLSEEANYGQAFLSDSAATDLSGMVQEDVKNVVAAVTESVTKENLWDAFEVFTKALETTDHPYTMARSMEQAKSAVKLRDTWLDMHGADIHDRATYMDTSGRDGYLQYRDAFNTLSTAFSTRLPDASPLENNVAVSAKEALSSRPVPVGIRLTVSTPDAPETREDAYGDSLLSGDITPDYSSMDDEQIRQAVESVSNRISKDTLWQALDVLAKVGNEAPNASVYIDAMADNNLPTRLRDTWLNMHGFSLNDRDAYTKMDGENGYRRYNEAYHKVSIDPGERAERESR